MEEKDMSRILVVVDMQKDFIDGSLGTKEAVAIVDLVKELVTNWEGTVVYTRDTHTEDYRNTQEGHNLPVPHCIRGSEGWELEKGLQILCEKAGSRIFDKPTFGSCELAAYLVQSNQAEPIEEILLAGLCTDICVISNALLIKAHLPEVPIAVKADCCAGATPESHERALGAMQMCQIAVK